MILSDPVRTLRAMAVNPWERLAHDWPQIPVRYEDFDDPYLHGLARWSRGRAVEIVLANDLTQVQRRCAIAHELEHLDRGQPCDSLRASIERRVVDATAKYLLPDLELLAETLAVYDMHRAALELWVTFPVLVERLRTLTDDQVAAVMSRCDAVA